MTDPNPALTEQTARADAARAQADQAMDALQKRIAAVKEAQSQAQSITGEATSRDGSVRVVVDSTGVVTALTLTPNAFERNTPEKLASAVVATVQSAAAQARGRMSASFSAVRGQDKGVFEASEAGAAALGLPKASVPEVPRTAVDPTGQSDPWARDPEPPAPPAPPAPAPVSPPREPTAPPVTSNRQRGAQYDEHHEEDQGDWFFSDESPR